MTGEVRQRDWLTVKEAAALLDVSHTTIHNWIRRGLIQANRIGPRIIRIRPESVHEILEEGSNG